MQIAKCQLCAGVNDNLSTSLFNLKKNNTFCVNYLRVFGKGSTFAPFFDDACSQGYANIAGCPRIGANEKWY